MNDRQHERPIDNYPRIRDGGWWLISSGVTQGAIGLWFVSRAWRGIDPGVSAAFAFLMGMVTMLLLVSDGEDDDR